MVNSEVNTSSSFCTPNKTLRTTARETVTGLHDFDFYVVQQSIHDFYTTAKGFPTLESLRQNFRRLQRQSVKSKVVGFEAFAMVVCYEDVCLLEFKPCSPLDANRCFGGRCSLHIQGWRLSKARNQHEVGRKQCLAWLTSQPWRRRRNILPKCRLTLDVLHSFIYLESKKYFADVTRTRSLLSPRYFLTMYLYVGAGKSYLYIEETCVLSSRE
jgi:hypothetical protein